MKIHAEYQHKSPSQTFIIKTYLPITSQITIGEGAYENIGRLLAQIGSIKKVLFVSQTSIGKEWQKSILDFIIDSGFEVHSLDLPDGEACKSTDSLIAVWNKLQTANLSRTDAIVALGGGAISDLVGFAGSTYMRGIRVVLIPTTLLAQVDASIGGKTAINLPHAKNLAGTFYFPNAVIVDPHFLSTLPENQFRSGLGEIIKYALIEETISDETEYKSGPKSLFAVLKEALLTPITYESPFLLNIISCCIKMKLAVVGKDPQEKDLRRSLNLGHTLGHALEKVSNFSLSHGEAVAIGLVYALFIASDLNKIDKKYLHETIELLQAAKLPTSIPKEYKQDQIMKAVWHDKKRESNSLKFILPKDKLGAIDFNFQLSIDTFEELLNKFYA